MQASVCWIRVLSCCRGRILWDWTSYSWAKPGMETVADGSPTLGTCGQNWSSMRYQCQGQETGVRGQSQRTWVLCLLQRRRKGDEKKSLGGGRQRLLDLYRAGLGITWDRSPGMRGKDSFALMKENVLGLFPFCMGDLSNLLPLCLLSPHAAVHSAIHPFYSTLSSLQTPAA